ncbi:MAG: hypothetical protein V2A79_09875 [Planctomycetota bacterium]
MAKTKERQPQQREDDWQVWTGGGGNTRRRKGCFLSISPCGTILISAELTAKLDVQQPYAKVWYSEIRKVLRVRPQSEITAGAYRWFHQDSKVARLAAAAALRNWGLKLEQATFYAAEFHAAAEGESVYIDADLTKILETAPARRKSRDTEPPAPGAPGRMKIGKCPDCGQIIGIRYVGDKPRFNPHPDPSGIACHGRPARQRTGD